MPALYPVFIGIGLMAGTYGLINMISAAMNQKEAGKMNGRANELLRNVSAESEMQESFFELESVMPALRKGILSGVWMGILAVFGAYVMAEELAAGRNFVRFHFGGVTENCTVSMVLGNGSLAVELAILAWIFSGTLVAILGTHVGKKAEENIERAYSDLFQAKRIKRKRKKISNMSEHDESYLLSEELEEYPWNMMDKIYDNEKISIWVSPCGIQKWYFKVFNHDMDKFCRISMTEPKILNYSDEALTLSNNDIDEIIYALTNNVIEDETGWFWLINEDETGWFWLINEYNIVGTDFPIPEDLPMPDYNLLKSVPAQRVNLVF